MVCLFHSDYGPADPAFKLDPGSTVGVRGWIVDPSSFKEARNIGEVEAIQRQLLADGVSVVLGTRAFDLLLVLLEADGLLVTKEELLSRVWPSIVVSEENLKLQAAALRKALGADRDVIRTEFGRGYRFIGAVCLNGTAHAGQSPMRPKPRSGRTLFPQSCRQSLRCSSSLS